MILKTTLFKISIKQNFVLIKGGYLDCRVMLKLPFNGQAGEVKKRPVVAISHMCFNWEHLGFTWKTQRLF